MPYLDNRGGGNCGYYAFSIAIIEIIQQELAQGQSLLLKKLKPFVPALDEKLFREFSFSAYQANIYSYKSDFLDSLQAALRNIAVRGYIDDLSTALNAENALSQDNISYVEGNETFSKFMEMVYALQQGKQSQHHLYNELASSAEVNELATKVLFEFNSTDLEFDDEPSRERALVSIAKKHFKKDILDEEMNVKPDSVIMSALKKINNSGYWATHDHLKQIAAKLEVNLNIDDQNVGANRDDHPTVVLKNHNNMHWTTKVDSITESSCLSGKQQAIYEATSNLIQAVCLKNNINGSIILEYLDYLVKNANNDDIFKINEDDSEDLKLAKELQEQELIDVGLRSKK